MKQFQSVVSDLIAFAIEIDTINAEQFDATVQNPIPAFMMQNIVNLQSFGYSISVVNKGSYYRIMIEKN